MVKSLHVNTSKKRRRKRFLCLRNASPMQGCAFKYKGKKNLGVWLYNGQKSYMLKATQVWRVHEVGPHSQISSKRLDHIHNSRPRGWITFTKSHPKGWTTLTNLIQEYSFMFGVEIMTIWTRTIRPFWYFFFDKCAHEVVQHLFFLTYAYMKLCFLTVEILQSGGGGGVFTYFLKSTVKTKLNAHSHQLVGWRNNFTLIVRPFLWVDYKNSKTFFRVISRPFFYYVHMKKWFEIFLNICPWSCASWLECGWSLLISSSLHTASWSFHLLISSLY
jgi:hypothetical protein